MRIEIDITSVTKEGDKIFGNIYFSNKKFYFPTKDWNDFIFIILNWWCSAIHRLLRNESIQDEFLFMDGPFVVKVNYIKEGVFNLTFLSDSVVKTSEVPINDFLNDFLAKINALIRKSNKLNWYNDEIEKLKINYKNIKMILKDNKLS